MSGGRITSNWQLDPREAGHIKGARLRAALPSGSTEPTKRSGRCARKRWSSNEALFHRASSSEPAAASGTRLSVQHRCRKLRPARPNRPERARTGIPPLALGLVAGGGAFSRSRNRLSGGRVGGGSSSAARTWPTATQRLYWTEAAPSTWDRALTVVGGAAVVGARDIVGSVGSWRTQMSAFIHAVFGLTDVQHVGKRKAITFRGSSVLSRRSDSSGSGSGTSGSCR